MKSFYIVFKNGESIEGKVTCTKEHFEENLIKPMKNLIHSYSVYNSLLELNVDLIDELI